MSDLFSQGPDIPVAPLDIPVPDIPSADFVAIGKNLEEGKQAAIAAAKGAPAFLDWIAVIMAKIVGSLLGLVLTALAKLLNLVFTVWKSAEFGTDQVAATAVSGMFGVPVSAGAFANVTDPGARQELSSQLAGVIVAALGADFTGPNAQPVAPSHAGADRFLSTTTHMAIEGWLQGWIFEAVSAGQVETFAELKDIMERTLGLGRLARRVLGPPIKILVEEPFTWLLNSTYRSTLLQPEMLVRQFLRGLIDRGTLDTVMSYHGYSADKIEAFINMNKVHLSLSQLETLELQGNIQTADAVAALEAQGYDASTANSALFAERATRIDAWSRQLVNEAMSAFVSGRIDIATWSNYVNTSGLPDAEKTYLLEVANLKLLNKRKRVSFGEAQQLVEQGIWSLDQFEELALQEGYTPADEQDMELLLLLKMKKASDAAAAKALTASTREAKAKLAAIAAAAKLADAAAIAEAKGVSIAQYTTLVKDGLRTPADFGTFLKGKGIAADNVAALTAELQKTLTATANAGTTRTAAVAAAKTKGLSLSELDKAVKAGIITIEDFATRVKESGVSDPDAQVLVELLTDEIATAAAKANQVGSAKGQAAAKHVDLAAEERAVKLGLQTMDQYAAFLDAQGYTPEDRDLLVSELKAQLDAVTAASTTKTVVKAGLTTKGISLSDMERAVRAGIGSVADYTAALGAHGYDANAQQALTALLQLHMQQDQANLAARGAASALFDQRGLSLADVERAVKLGVLPASAYTDALSRAGVNAADAKTLALILASSMKSTANAKTTKTSASAQLAQVGLSLPSIEKDVLDGKLTIEQLTALLGGAGVSTTDQTAIAGLVSDQLANQKALLTLTAGADARAAAKGLNLSQETAAVKAGVKTIDDYAAFIAALGYDAADVDTLVATLAAQIAAKPAKTAGTPPAAAPGA